MTIPAKLIEDVARELTARAAIDIQGAPMISSLERIHIHSQNGQCD